MFSFISCTCNLEINLLSFSYLFVDWANLSLVSKGILTSRTLKEKTLKSTFPLPVLHLSPVCLWMLRLAEWELEQAKELPWPGCCKGKRCCSARVLRG